MITEILRRTIYILAVVLTFYMAGFFSSRPLLFLFFLEILLPSGLFAGIGYLAHRIQIEIQMQDRAIRKDWVHGQIQIQVQGWGLFTRFLKNLIGDIKVTVLGPDRKESAVLCFDTSTVQKHDCAFQVQHCGIVVICVQKIQVTDCFGCFHVAKCYKNKGSFIRHSNGYSVQHPICVYPRMLSFENEDIANKNLPEHNPEAFAGILSEHNLTISNLDDYELRLYQTGDHLKNIHWKLQARTGELWSRHWMDTADGSVSFCMDLRGYETLTPYWRDGFWEISETLIGAFLMNASCQLRWYHPATCEWHEQVIFHLEEFHEIMRMIFWMEAGRREDTGVDVRSFHPEYPNQLDCSLHLWLAGQLVTTFSPDDYEKRFEHGLDIE